jgi:LacI family transcriptional regulator
LKKRPERSASARVTLADLARESGFSVSTISIVLNEAPLSQFIAAGTKARIHAVAKRLGYHPNAYARSLRKRRSHTIGVLVIDLSDPFCTLILKSIEKTLSDTEFLPLIMDAANQHKQFKRYLNILLEHGVEGLIVVANWLLMDTSLLADLEQYKIPTTLVGTEIQDSTLPSILVDNEQGGYLALQHLYSLGHRAVAFIRGPHQLIDSSRRWQGILRFAAEVDLQLRDQWIMQLSKSSDPNASFEEGRILTQEALQKQPGFSALLAFDDVTALGAIRALQQHNIRIPQDCSVIGFDDVPYAALSNPGLTTIRQPMEEMGRLAANRVLERLSSSKNDLAEQALLLPPELVSRKSTAVVPLR